MGSVRAYGGLIWTNHALDRLKERGLPQDLAWQAYRYPDDVEENTYKQSKTYIKRFDKYLVTTIIKQNEKKELIVVSTWVSPPMKHTADYRNRNKYHGYQKASTLGKIWHAIKQQIFG